VLFGEHLPSRALEGVEPVGDVGVRRPADDPRVTAGGIDPVLDVIPLTRNAGGVFCLDGDPQRAQYALCHAGDATDKWWIPK
jgi:hypothetical protein